MSLEHQRIAFAAARLADELPYATVIALAEAVALNSAKDWSTARAAILETLSAPGERSAAANFLDLWTTSTESVGIEAVVASLLTAAECRQEYARNAATK